MKIKNTDNQFIKFWCLIILTIIIAYFTTSVLSYLFFLLIMRAFFLSKTNNYFWVAFWLVIIDGPGDLFSVGLPALYGEITIINIIPLVLLYKSLFSYNKNIKLVFRNDYYFLICMLFIYFLLGFVYGMTLNNILNTGLIFILWTSLFSLPRLLSQNDIINLDRIFFTVVFVAFFCQLITLFTGTRIIDYIHPSLYSPQSYIEMSDTIIARYMSSPYIILYSLIKALYYMNVKKTLFTSKYLSSIITSAFFSIFLTGTRGWILAAFILILIYLFFFGRQVLKKMMIIVFIGIIIIKFSIMLSPKLQQQIDGVFIRLQTLEYLAKGDITMDNKLWRVTNRAPKVLAPFYKKPLFGEGFSTVYWENRDRHVGHATILLNTGIVGYLIFSFFLLRWFYKIFTISNVNKAVKRNYANAPKIISFAFIFIFVIHSTSHMFWGFDLEIGPVFVISMLLTTFNDILITSTYDKSRHAHFS